MNLYNSLSPRYQPSDKSNIGINKLITIANTVFGIAIKLKNNEPRLDYVTLKENLYYEIKTFTSKALLHKKYDSTTINDACIVLCDFIDDTLCATPWGQANNWEQNSLMAMFNLSIKGKSFFSILKQAKENPTLNLDLLELMYLSLSLGYGGKYREQKRGDALLTLAREELYVVITKIRHFDNIPLLANAPTEKTITLSRPQKKFKLFSRPTLFITITLFLFGFITFGTINSKLDTALNPIVKLVRNINSMPDNLIGQ